jgi:Zn-dependent peptidase ImmA (M78 family)/DNA-binding XRE family transcriptional regulator
MIGERIKAAREGNRLSLRSLADQVGVSQTAIHKYERGQDVPGSIVLVNLSRALGLPLDYFFRQTSVSLSGVSFRRRYRFGAKKQRQVISLADDLLERYFFIESLFPSEQRSFVRPKALSGPLKSLDDMEDHADRLREEWQLGYDPIKSLIEELESRAVKVVLLDITDDAFDGFSGWIDDIIPVIGVSKYWPGDRQRFTVAHELGHLLLQGTGADLDKEKLANRFAGAFLLPQSTVVMELGKSRTVFSVKELTELKQKYGVSMSVWVRRARDLGIITESRYAEIMRKFGQKGWRKKEPGENIPSEMPHRMERFVLRALMEGIVSIAKAAEILSTSIGIIRGKLHPLGGELSFESDSR